MDRDSWFGLDYCNQRWYDLTGLTEAQRRAFSGLATTGSALDVWKEWQ
jgi:hypothetical protein